MDLDVDAKGFRHWIHWLDVLLPEVQSGTHQLTMPCEQRVDRRHSRANHIGRSGIEGRLAVDPSLNARWRRKKDELVGDPDDDHTIRNVVRRSRIKKEEKKTTIIQPHRSRCCPRISHRQTSSLLLSGWYQDLSPVSGFLVGSQCQCQLER